MEIEVHYEEDRHRHLLPSQFMPVDNEHGEHKNKGRGKYPVGTANIKIAQADGAGLFFFF